jgi:hypothetical protein
MTGRLAVRAPEELLPLDLHGAVIIAVIAMGMMQMTVDQVVDVVAMRHRLMSAAGAMDVARGMAGAAVIRRASIGISLGNLDHMLVDVIPVHVVEVTIMEIVHMAVVADGRMTAAFAVNVAVALMVGQITARHPFSLPKQELL